MSRNTHTTNSKQQNFPWYLIFSNMVKKFSLFTEPEYSLSWSQDGIFCASPDEFISSPLIFFLEVQLFFHRFHRLRFYNRNHICISSLPCVPHAFTYLLTYSIVQSPSWEANWFTASQEIPRISRNPKVHHRTHKRPPTVPILDQPNPVYIPTSHLLEIRPNIIHPSTPRSPQWFFPSGSPPKPHTLPSPHPYGPHAQPI